MTTPALSSLSILFASGLTNAQVRELCEAATGIKLSRINLYDWQIAPVREWCEKHKVAVAVADYYVQENVQEEYKGRWSNIGRRDNDDGFRFVYVSLESGDAARGLEAERAQDFAPEQMGQLLHIPPCCTAFFKEHKQEALDRFLDEYAPLTTVATRSQGPFNWPMNYLAQYFGYSLFSHYVCRWDCPETMKRAERSKMMVGDISGVWLASFERHMRGVAIIESWGPAHMVLGVPDADGWVHAPAHRIVSTVPTDLSRAIRSAGGLRWRGIRDFSIPGLSIKDPEVKDTCAISFS
jgi:hypothetical protein